MNEQWLRHVYNDDYVKVDPEYQEIRPRRNARRIAAFLAGKKDRITGLDYGGGNGLTAALLRRGGWTFDSYDPFGHTDISDDRIGRYDFCSAVFEHVPDPAGALRAIVERTSPGRLMILIGTDIHDGIVSDTTRLSWWYAVLRNGHISLYSRKSLRILASKFGLIYTNFRITSGTHLLTRGIKDSDCRIMLLRAKLLRRARSALGM